MAQTKFFCDNCGTEVPQESEVCPQCGRGFSSVRCPICGFVGEVASFKEGCPSCGYSAASEEKKMPLGPQTKLPVLQAERSVHLNSAGDYNIWSLPLWVYIVTGLALLTVCIALYSKLQE
ncbi:MAG: zinc ribbon domain-containing protein [Spirochaetaceae bacterium]|jgi:RNA polymerase subunit RPABC4/transcription elongation factor Spt4|nr:zinc ribbon domain-containing protein [Spirochaetaceae bacterium]